MPNVEGVGDGQDSTYPMKLIDATPSTQARKLSYTLYYSSDWTVQEIISAGSREAELNSAHPDTRVATPQMPNALLRYTSASGIGRHHSNTSVSSDWSKYSTMPSGASRKQATGRVAQGPSNSTAKKATPKRDSNKSIESRYSQYSTELRIY